MTKHSGDQAHSITLKKPYAWPGTGLVNGVDKVGARSAFLLRRVSRLAAFTNLAVLVESDPAALGVDIAEGSVGFFGSALAVDPAGRILPIRVTLMAGPAQPHRRLWSSRRVNPAIAGNPRDLHHGHGPYLFLELTPRLRGWAWSEPRTSAAALDRSVDHCGGNADSGERAKGWFSVLC